MLSLSRFAYLCRFVAWFFITAPATAQQIPPEIDAAIVKARIPKDAISLYAIDASPNSSTPLLAHRATNPINPASVMKLVTSVAALDLLGPAYTWQTQVLSDATIKDGALQGNLIIKGGGDPKLVVERLWALLIRVRSLGIQAIQGDIVIDSSAFDVLTTNPAAFDGEPTRPYNAGPEALLINFKSVVMTFTPITPQGIAAIHYEPPLYGVTMPASVPLTNADCSDYRTSLRADFSDPKLLRFGGGYPKNCGERIWPIAYVNPSGFASLAIRALWENIGGKLGGTVRMGPAPKEAKLLLAYPSQSLGEVMRDMNKFSNNVMAQQIFLSLSMSDKSPASFVASRRKLQEWWSARLPGTEPPVVDNGSGLSRDERITALSLAKLLQAAYAAPYMPELLASLPQSGVDGTMRRSKAAGGIAHLKTGSLNNVVARAGFVDATSANKEGRRYVLIAIINSSDPQVLAGGRVLFDTLIDWVARQ